LDSNSRPVHSNFREGIRDGGQDVSGTPGLVDLQSTPAAFFRELSVGGILDDVVDEMYEEFI